MGSLVLPGRGTGLELLRRTRFISNACKLGCFAAFLPAIVCAQIPVAAPPPAGQVATRNEPVYRLPRYEEDWSYRSDSATQNWFGRKLKYMPLRKAGKWYASMGGDARLMYERFTNPDFGASPEDKNGYWLQRYLIHADLHLGNAFRFFSQFKSAIELGRAGSPRFFDEDDLDVHQAFLEVRFLQREALAWMLRAGRQEMTYGSGRLVSLREGPNVPLSFDGVRSSLRLRAARIDLFITRPVATNRGIFDDGWEKGRTFWGGYGTQLLRFGQPVQVDVYYLGIRNNTRRYDQGIGREIRHSCGGRLYGKHSGLRYDGEVIGQLGKFGESTIRAWRAATEVSYTFSVRYSPQLGLKADIASGDRNPDDPDLQTFNALFQSGEYSGRAGILGPANAIELEPTGQLNLRKNLRLVGGWGFFWRESTRDGIYTIGSTLLNTGQFSRERFLGSRTTAELHWQATPQLSLHANYIYVFTSRFAEETPPPSGDLSYLGLWMAFGF